MSSSIPSAAKSAGNGVTGPAASSASTRWMAVSWACPARPGGLPRRPGYRSPELPLRVSGPQCADQVSMTGPEPADQVGVRRAAAEHLSLGRVSGQGLAAGVAGRPAVDVAEVAEQVAHGPGRAGRDGRAEAARSAAAASRFPSRSSAARCCAVSMAT